VRRGRVDQERVGHLRPVTGTIVARNDAAETSPETLNADPYGDGWLAEVEVSDPATLDDLLDAAGYLAVIGG
jgi:glycine cleavage system H protein